jgi:hypothetical protein
MIFFKIFGRQKQRMAAKRAMPQFSHLSGRNESFCSFFEEKIHELKESTRVMAVVVNI